MTPRGSSWLVATDSWVVDDNATWEMSKAQIMPIIGAMLASSKCHTGYTVRCLSASLLQQYCKHVRGSMLGLWRSKQGKCKSTLTAWHCCRYMYRRTMSRSMLVYTSFVPVSYCG